MRRNYLSAILLAAFIFNSLAFAQVKVKLTSDERRVADGVTADQLRNYLFFVASDEMEGRDTPSRGLDLTAKFIGLNLKNWGLKPAGDDGSESGVSGCRRGEDHEPSVEHPSKSATRSSVPFWSPPRARGRETPGT